MLERAFRFAASQVEPAGILGQRTLQIGTGARSRSRGVERGGEMVAAAFAALARGAGLADLNARGGRCCDRLESRRGLRSSRSCWGRDGRRFLGGLGTTASFDTDGLSFAVLQSDLEFRLASVGKQRLQDAGSEGREAS